MLTRPNDGGDRGRGLTAMTYPPPPSADGDNNTQPRAFSSSPAWSSSPSPPSFSAITTSPSCSSLTCALSHPPPASSMPSSSVSFPSPPSSVDCPLLSCPTDSSISLFPCQPIKYNSNSSSSPSPDCLPSTSSCTSLPTSSTHPSVSSPHFSPSSSSPGISVSSSIFYSPASHTAPALPPLPPPCCSCSTLLPRLLAAHRLEVRRLLRGALATLSHRLDSLERGSRRNVRRKRSRQTREEEGVPSSHEPATSPLSPSLTDDEEDEEMNGKRRKKQRDIGHSFKNREEDNVEKDGGRFVVQMAVSFGGGEEGAPLLLHNLNHSRRADRGSAQPERTVTIYRPNGFRTPPMLQLSISSSSSQRSLHLMQSAHSSQSETLDFSSGRWCFSNILLPCSILPNPRAVHQWLSSSPFSHLRPAVLLKLSAAAAEKILESMRGRPCGSPLRSLKDWTPPPSLSTDHCYMQILSLSLTPSDVVRHQNQRNSPRLHLPQRRPLAFSPCLTNGPPAVLPNGQTIPGTVVQPNKERGKRVSQIRIRRGPPRETPLTPMGLPKVKRLKKKEFSLEEIYTNKNYKSPTSNRTLETIFEEPREKDGTLLRIGHQKRRRLLLFPDYTQPRKRRRAPGVGPPIASMPKKRVASRRCHGSSPVDDESDVDVMLVERLSALDDFLTQQGLDV